MNGKYTIETQVIEKPDPDCETINGFRRVRRGVLTRLRCNECGNVLREKFTPDGHPLPGFDQEMPHYPCSERHV